MLRPGRDVVTTTIWSVLVRVHAVAVDAVQNAVAHRRCHGYTRRDAVESVISAVLALVEFKRRGRGGGGGGRSGSQEKKATACTAMLPSKRRHRVRERETLYLQLTRN